ncbi:MAG TPA: stage II sporulation protein M [Alphaproteobacteria bacterium]|nr:stage II sporulation protein M [Alphaproteobacteria bacterium]
MSGATETEGLRLKSSEFRKAREASWRDLESLIARAEKKGARSLSAEELQRLPLLYRATLSSLSVARSVALDRNLLLYLENLALRAFLVVYAPHARQLESVVDFLLRGFPAAVRRARWHFLIALLLQIVGGVAGYLLTIADESWFTAIVPASLAGDRGPSSTHDSLYNDEIHAPWPGFAESFALTANFLFSHNTVVGILIFSLGVAAGAPSVLLLIYQGLIMGAFLALHADRGLLVEILGWLSIHGITEITAITLCGAGGLLIADKILFPGRHSRLDTVAREGRAAAQIAIGAIPLLFVAGILEGGFRQLVQSTAWRFAIGGTSGLLWLAYFMLSGRRAR